VRTRLFAGAAIAALLSAGAASAEPNGWYGAIDAGWNMFGDEPVATSTTPSADFDLGVENGWAAFGRLGYRFNPNWRVELEGGHRTGDFVSADRADYGLPAPPTAICSPAYTGANACGGPEGDLNATTLMANVIYDFGPSYFGMRPFVGLGLGVNRVNTEFAGRIGQNPAATISADDSSTSFAAQALAGVAWAVSDRANIDVTYRYLRSEFDFDSSVSSAPAALGAFDGDYDSHTVTLGLRYAFGADAPEYTPAPPPPPPAPTPPPLPAEREFVVYFDWDRSDLTTEASSVVTQAANYARSGRPTRILIVGHADTSGSAAYNVGLSNRRSRTVADALVAQGVNGGVISLDGKGETALARPTADGVREPLNRRATIGINFR